MGAPGFLSDVGGLYELLPPLSKDVFIRLKLFPSAIDEKDENKRLYGDAAITYLWAAVQNKMTSKAAVGLNDLEVFQTYKFMLSSEQVKTLSTWVCDLLKGSADVGSHGPAGPPKPPASSAKAKANASAKATLHTSKANILALFGKAS